MSSQSNTMLPLSPDSYSLDSIVLSHFESHQHKSSDARCKSTKDSSVNVEARAARLNKDISEKVQSFTEEAYVAVNSKESDENADPQTKTAIRNAERYKSVSNEITSALLQCVNAAFMASSLRSSSATNDDDIYSIFDLAAAFSSRSVFGELRYVDNDVFASLLEKGSQASRAALDSVRSSGCVLLGLCVKHFVRYISRKRDRGDLEKLDEASIKKIHNITERALMPRLTDKSQIVRQSAIQACAFFFAGKVSKEESIHLQTDHIEKVLIENLAHDPSVSNRSVALECIPISERTISHILERVRDVKVRVRVGALEILKNKVDVKMLTEDQRVTVLRDGLSERCSSTYEAASKMLCCGWFKSLKFEPLELLRILDPAFNETICESAMKAIIQPIMEEKSLTGKSSSVLNELSDPERNAYHENIYASLDLENTVLDASKAFLLRMRCFVIMESESLTVGQKSDQVSKIVPDLLVLCEILQKHLGLYIGSVRERNKNKEDSKESFEDEEQFEEEQCFICLQLLQVVLKADLQEEGGRRHFLAFMHNMLCSSESPDELVEACIRAMAAMHSKEAEFLESMLEVLKLVNDYDNKEGSLHENELHSRQMRCLSIISVLLEHTKASTGDLEEILNMIVPCVSSSNNIVREAAVSCIGKYALLSHKKSVETNFAPLLLESANSEKEPLEVRAQAVLAMCDIALVFDDMLFPPDSDAEGTDLLCLHSILSRQLTHSNAGFVAVSAEACTKLFLASKLKDTSMLARLILIYFDISSASVCAEDWTDEFGEVGSSLRLEQLLSVFFPAYSMRSSGNRDLLLGSIKPLLGIYEDKFRSSGKRKNSNCSVPIAKILDFISSILTLGSDSETEVEITRKEGEKEENSGRRTDEDSSSRSSPKIAILISLSEFLLERHTSLAGTYLRMLCKIFGAAKSYDLIPSTGNMNIRESDSKLLICLKKNVDELTTTLTDYYALAALENLSLILQEVYEAEDDESGASSNTESTEEDRDDESDNIKDDGDLASDEKSVLLSAGRYQIQEGMKISKFFKKYGTFHGVVSRLPTKKTPWYMVKYDDGDEEEFSEDELMRLIAEENKSDSFERGDLSNTVKENEDNAKCHSVNPSVDSDSQSSVSESTCSYANESVSEISPGLSLDSLNFLDGLKA